MVFPVHASAHFKEIHTSGPEGQEARSANVRANARCGE
jgi:hypothetical protein